MKKSTIILLFIFGAMLGFSLQVWLVMLLLSYVHSFIPAVPAWGYWETFSVMVLLDILIGLVRGNSKQNVL